MELENLYDMLFDEIEKRAEPFYTREYYRQVNCVEEHLQWLSDHLDEEGNAHLEQARDSEIHAMFMERNALVRAAVTIGIRLAFMR